MTRILRFAVLVALVASIVLFGMEGVKQLAEVGKNTTLK